MRWTDTTLRNKQIADVQFGEVVNVSFLNSQEADIQLDEIVNVAFFNSQIVDVGYGNMVRQDSPGPIPPPNMHG